MVAPAPTGASGNRANHVQCTQQRWNLKNRIQFPQWNLELVSLVRRQTDRNFLTSTPPSNPLEENDDNDGVHTRKYTSTQELSATHALTIYAQWTAWNETVYDIMLGSLDLQPSELTIVAALFQPTSDGLAMYKWACSFNDATSESAQLKMENHFKTIVITADMDSSRIDTVLQQIQDIYPKIKRFQYEHAADKQSITHAFNLFPQSHPDIAYIKAFQVMHEFSTDGAWKTFHDFRLDIVEKLACAEQRRGPAGATEGATSFATVQQQNQQQQHSGNARKPFKTQKNNCTTCDLRLCNGSPCNVFGGGQLPRSYRFANVVAAFRAFAKEKGYKTSMKGVEIPTAWWEAHKRIAKSARDERQHKASASSATTGNVKATTVETEPDQTYWDVLHSEVLCVAIDDDGDSYISEIQALAKTLTDNMGSEPQSPVLLPVETNTDEGPPRHRTSATELLTSPQQLHIRTCSHDRRPSRLAR